MQRSSDMLGQIEGTLIGIRVVKAAAAERFERRRYSRFWKACAHEQLKMARYEAWATPAMETVAMVVVGDRAGVRDLSGVQVDANRSSAVDFSD